MPMNDRDRLHRAMQKEYGNEYIIVYMPRELDYYVCESSLRPGYWREVLLSVVRRL